jgi:hypothetical protein
MGEASRQAGTWHPEGEAKVTELTIYYDGAPGQPSSASFQIDDAAVTQELESIGRMTREGGMYIVMEQGRYPLVAIPGRRIRCVALNRATS